VRRAAVDVQDTLATGGVEGFEFGSSRVVVEELSSAMCISKYHLSDNFVYKHISKRRHRR
jgi:hypothetical protein